MFARPPLTAAMLAVGAEFALVLVAILVLAEALARTFVVVTRPSLLAMVASLTRLRALRATSRVRRYVAVGFAEIAPAMMAMMATMLALLALARFASGCGSRLIARLGAILMAMMTVTRAPLVHAAAGPPDLDELRLGFDRGGGFRYRRFDRCSLDRRGLDACRGFRRHGFADRGDLVRCRAGRRLLL